MLEQKQVRLHSVMSMSEILQVLEEEKILDLRLIESIRNFLATTQIDTISTKKRISYSEKAILTTNPVAKKLLEIMEMKQSNLAVAVDVTKKSELLKITEQIGKHICLLKTHVDIIEDFDLQFIEDLKKLSEKYQFLIFVHFKNESVSVLIHHFLLGR